MLLCIDLQAHGSICSSLLCSDLPTYLYILQQGEEGSSSRLQHHQHPSHVTLAALQTEVSLCRLRHAFRDVNHRVCVCASAQSSLSFARIRWEEEHARFHILWEKS